MSTNTYCRRYRIYQLGWLAFVLFYVLAIMVYLLSVRSSGNTHSSKTNQLLMKPSRRSSDSDSRISPDQAVTIAARDGGRKEKLIKKLARLKNDPGFVPVYFLHFHKSGGSTFCKIATSSGNSMLLNQEQKITHNCNLPGDGPYSMIHMLHAGVVYDYKRSCSQRSEFIKNNSVSYFAVESPPFHLDYPCPEHFVSMTVLREPIERIMSNMRIHNITKEMAIWWLHKDRVIEHKTVRGSNAFNNHYTRIFLGHDRYFDPLDSFTKRDLDWVKAKLRQFDFVIPLDKLNDPAPKAFFQKYIGWKVEYIPGNRHRRPRKKKKRRLVTVKEAPDYNKGHSATFAPRGWYEQLHKDKEFIDILREHNKLDLELWDLALKVYQEQVADYELER